MPVKSIEKEGFAYIAYRREGTKDYMDFKAEVEAHVKKDGGSNDIVLDLTKSDSLTEDEMGVLAEVLGSFRGTKRALRLILSKPIHDKLDSQNFFKANNLSAYDNHASFLEFLKKRNSG
jgi:prephenate dehydratase